MPATGYIGPGVYAQSSTEYSRNWSWSSVGDDFHWYVWTGGGKLKGDGGSVGGGGSLTISGNNHYWKSQDQGSGPMAWMVCFSS